MPITEKDIDALENDLKVLKPAVAELETNITKINATRDHWKKELKEHLQTAKDLGVDDPDNLPQVIQKLFEVARIKTDNIKEEVKAGNEIVQPILKEME